MIPATEFVRSGDVDLAYKVVGDGPRDLLLAFPLASNVDVFLELPENLEFVERLAGLGRVILFDKRGTGMSDRSESFVPIEQHSDDILAVLDAAGSERAVLAGWFDGGAACLVAAARHPDRVESVIAAETIAVGRPDDGFPWEFSARFGEAALRRLVSLGWGKEPMIRAAVPEWADDPRLITWLTRYMRLSAPPSAVERLIDQALELDIREYLGRVAAPVLVLHEPDYPGLPTEAFQWLAHAVPDGRLQLLRHRTSVPFVVPSDDLVDEIEEFLVGTRSGGRRELASIVFTDVVGSTVELARSGDRRWGDLLAAQREAIRRSTVRYGGREVNTAGDGFVATFPLPSSALRFAADAVASSASMGLGLRAGVHSGEVLVRDDDLVGIAVHVAARVSALADSGQVFATDTVRVLVEGSGLAFDSVGDHELKGVPGTWGLFRLADGAT